LLEKTPGAQHDRAMAGSLFTIEYFSCPNCALPYSATREQHSSRHSGSFACEVCHVKVHTWSGNCDFFDWKVDQPEAREFGKRWPAPH
jgi:hypothetical protein